MFLETGKPIQLIVDPDKRQMLDDLVALFFEGVTLNRLPVELYKRFGHVNPNTGRYYAAGTFTKLLYNPWFWGHSAQNYEKNHHHRHGADGPWVCDSSEAASSHVKIYYNTTSQPTQMIS